jgi:hypothetical protein
VGAGLRDDFPNHLAAAIRIYTKGKSQGRNGDSKAKVLILRWTGKCRRIDDGPTY